MLLVIVAFLIMGPAPVRIAVGVVVVGFVIFAYGFDWAVRFRPGNRVKIVRGPYAGAQGKVHPDQDPRPAAKLRVVVEEDGQEITREVSQYDAEKLWFGRAAKPFTIQIPASWKRLGPSAIVVQYGGSYPPGSKGNDFAHAMIEFLEKAIAEAKPEAVIPDLTQLDYVWGDAICGLAMALYDGARFRPAALIATGKTAEALKPLFEPSILFGIAGVKLVGTMDEAVEHVERVKV